MKKADLNARLQGLTDRQQKSVTCALIGHSKIVGLFFGLRHVQPV